MFLGIEIGGTKLQLALGLGDGRLLATWRGQVDRAAGGEGIRFRILEGVPELLGKSQIDRASLRGIGIGFGGPTDDATQSAIKSHHIHGWDDFPLATWAKENLGLPTVICNDADTAGLGEALHGSGRGLSPIFYITLGSGVGGGLIIDGRIYRGAGRGATEIGHLYVSEPLTGRSVPLDSVASGWGIEQSMRRYLLARGFTALSDVPIDLLTAKDVAAAARSGDLRANEVLNETWDRLAGAITSMITLLCPRRVVIGGGVSLMGDLLFVPLRQLVAGRTFPPFAGLTEIVPASLGEEVVLHGALALARGQFGV